MKKKDKRKVPQTSDVNFDDLKIEVTDETKKGLKGLRTFIEYWDKELKPFLIESIQGALPYYLHLSQISESTDRFVEHNNINVEYIENVRHYDTYESGKPLKDSDKKVLNAFRKQSDKIYDEVIEKKICIDFGGIHAINTMMFEVDTDISNFKNPALKMIHVFGNFSDDEYYATVFKGIEDCSEAKTYKEIAKKLEHAFGILKEVK